MEATLFFTHIKKTAGTSVKRSVFGPNVAEENRHRPGGYRSALAARGEFNFVEGHFPYGMHLFYGCKNPRYFVMLRDPIDRAVSHYHFVKECKSSSYTHPQYQYAKQNSIVEFYEDPAFQNLQTRVVSGLFSEYAGRFFGLNGIWNDVVLGKAKHNLIERYEAFGLKEQFDASVRLFADCINVQPRWPERRHKNTPERPSVSDLDERTRTLLRKRNALDVELYEFARAHFDAQKLS